jgi:transcriptional regulator
VYRVLEEASVKYETPERAPWTLAEPPADFMEGMLRGIVGIRLEISSMVGKFKLSQNQPAENRETLVAALREKGHPEATGMADAILAHRPR